MQRNLPSTWPKLWKLSLRNIPLLFLLFFCVSCGYRMEGSYSSGKTVSVPFVEGDVDGRLTTEIVKALVQETNLKYIPTGGDLTLAIRILDRKREHIGYKYDQEEITGELINRLVPDEGRREVIVELTVLENGRQVFGPVQVTANSDYDFVNSDTLDDVSFVDQLGERQSILTFSLGQLDAWEGASDVALNAAYYRIAKKIVDGIRRL